MKVVDTLKFYFANGEVISYTQVFDVQIPFVVGEIVTAIDGTYDTGSLFRITSIHENYARLTKLDWDMNMKYSIPLSSLIHLSADFVRRHPKIRYANLYNDRAMPFQVNSNTIRNTNSYGYSHFEVGDMVTVTGPKREDRSYQGDLFRIEAIEDRFVILQKYDYYEHNCNRIVLDTNNFALIHVSPGFVSVHPGYQKWNEKIGATPCRFCLDRPSKERYGEQFKVGDILTESYGDLIRIVWIENDFIIYYCMKGILHGQYGVLRPDEIRPGSRWHRGFRKV